MLMYLTANCQDYLEQHLLFGPVAQAARDAAEAAFADNEDWFISLSAKVSGNVMTLRATNGQEDDSSDPPLKVRLEREVPTSARDGEHLFFVEYADDSPTAYCLMRPEDH